MTEPLKIDSLEDEEAEALLLTCCGAKRWVGKMMEARPFGDEESLLKTGAASWVPMEKEDRLEAFAAHPKIGEAPDSGEQSDEGAELSAQEQKAVAEADPELAEKLAEGNAAYEEKFGWTFIIRAEGKEPDEILAELERRLENDEETELDEAAEQQYEITHLRLMKAAV